MAMEYVAWIASLLVFCSFFMRTMIPLRVVAVASNVAFVVYALLGLKFGVFEKVYPILVLHAALLPLNLRRLHQMRRLITNVRQASDERAIECLVPYMRSGRYVKGEVLFRKGDTADRMYLIEDGAVELPELGRRLEKGAVFGEVGLFAPGHERAASAVCAADSRLYSISGDKVLELFYQNPQFGFFVTRLVSGTLLQQSTRLAPATR